MKTLIHDLRNDLAVAIANLEAFLDGKLAPTPERLQVVLESLNDVDRLVDQIAAKAFSESSPDVLTERTRP